MLKQRIAIIFIVYFLLVLPLICLSNTFEDDFDGDGINDKIQNNRLDNTLHIKMWLSSINKKMSYAVKLDDENKTPTIHRSYKKGYFELDSTYHGVQGDIYIELYKWSLDKKNWILTKIIIGETPDPLNDKFTPSLQVTNIECCHLLGSNINYKKVDEAITQKKVNEILGYRISLYNKGKVEKAIKDIDIYDAVEYQAALNDKNLVFLNNLAFYLEENNPTASAIILEQILKKYPDRLAAKLNLADSYWSIMGGNNAPKIRRLYQEYKDMMINKGLEEKIPKRVFERSK